MQIVPPVYLLQTLVVFAEQENLVQTAERLGLTQPTVSRQLQQLEELFPQPLFTQQGRNKVLTAYGLALAQELKPRFLDLERVFEKVDQTFADPRSIQLRVGGPRQYLHYLFAEAEFEGALDLADLSETEIEEAIQAGNLDVAVTTCEVSNPIYKSKLVFRDQLVLAIPSKWAKGIDTVKDWAERCESLPFAEDAGLRGQISDFENKFKTRLKRNWSSADRWLLEKKAHQQFAWTIVPISAVSDDRAYKIIPLDRSFDMALVFLSYRKDLSKHSWMENLLSQIA